MPNISPSSNPSTLLMGYASILATLMGQSLMAGTAIAQSIPRKASNPTPLSTLTFDFSHPLPPETISPETVSPETVDLGERPEPWLLEKARPPNPTHSLTTLDFTFSLPLTAAHSAENNDGVMHHANPLAQATLKALSPAHKTAALPASLAPSTLPASPALPLNTLFSNHSNSLIAIAIGSAEGTRSPDGGKTWAYNGHTDPGNGVWNMGTFSWQHGANSPEEADRKQLARLRKQAIVLTQKAEEAGIPWGLEEQLNALDLANQSPSAALNPGGYIDRLKEAQEEGLKGSDAILWARTWSYRHPSGTRWNAPGLGNTHYGIRTDQKRRQNAIKAAMTHYFD